MIEVEKKFEPAPDKLTKLLAGSEFLGKKINDDQYFDYPDYRLLKNRVRLRMRNGTLELKIGGLSGVAREIDDETGIKEYFNTELPLKDFIAQNLKSFIQYKTIRNEYTKEGFIIDIDECDFGYSSYEIELLIDDENKIKETQDKIKSFAEQYGIMTEKTISKRDAYLQKMRPEIYKEIFMNKETNNELNKLK